MDDKGLLKKTEDYLSDNALAITQTCKGLKEFLIEKNKRYGDSALHPLEIFKKVIESEDDFAIKAILVRLQDKLKRIQNADRLKKNDVADLIGYFILLCVKKDWLDFTDLLD